jgi:hypothetical protein
MRVDFERYYLPILLGEVVAIGTLVGVVTSLLLTVSGRRPVPASAKATA